MNKDLTKGPVLHRILQLAIPIIGTSFMQFAYNFTDMLWVGRLGSNAVAAVGTAGFFLHLGWAIASVIFVGCGISVSQAIGRKKYNKSQYLSINAFVTVLLVSLIYVSLIQVEYKHLIVFFGFNNANTEQMADVYLRWSSIGLFFVFISRLFSRISNARGDSKLPFKIISIGIVINIILDPILIFVFHFGVLGAALATIVSQLIVASLFWNKRSTEFLGKRSSWKFSIEPVKKMVKLGLAPSTQYMIFSLVAIIMGKIVAGFGSNAIAAQKIGLQIEAISFMTIGGFNGAILSFAGQNFGAKLYERVRTGFKVGIKIAVVFGSLTTILFLLFSKHMVMWFVKDAATVQIGTNYLYVVGMSQLFLCIDFISTGVINGIGKTKLPATSNIMMILVRIPLALWLSKPDNFGINGIWFAILISSALRGLINTTIYLRIRKKMLPIT